MHKCHGIASSYCKLDDMIDSQFDRFTVWSGLNFLLHLSICSNITDVMIREYNTWTKKEVVVSNEALAKVEENIISTVNCLKEEIIALKTL